MLSKHNPKADSLLLAPWRFESPGEMVEGPIEMEPRTQNNGIVRKMCAKKFCIWGPYQVNLRQPCRNLGFESWRSSSDKCKFWGKLSKLLTPSSQILLKWWSHSCRNNLGSPAGAIINSVGGPAIWSWGKGDETFQDRIQKLFVDPSAFVAKINDRQNYNTCRLQCVRQWLATNNSSLIEEPEKWGPRSARRRQPGLRKSRNYQRFS